MLQGLYKNIVLVFLLISFSVSLFSQTAGSQSTSLMVVYNTDDSGELELKQLSQSLVSLLSRKRTDIQAAGYTCETMGSDVTSQQYVLILGKSCSSSLKFSDEYSDLGIHIGYNGKRAWIKCNEFGWTKDKFFTFEALLERYCKENNLSARYNNEYLKKDRSRVLREFKTGKESWTGEKLSYKSEDGLGDWVSGVGSSLLVYGVPTIRKYQYLLASLMFCDKYLNKYITPKVEVKYQTQKVVSKSKQNTTSKQASISSMFVKSDFASFKEGYDYYVTLLSAKKGSQVNEANGGKYLKDLHTQIELFKQDVNSYQNNKNPSAHGYLAEVWHKNTFDIDAIAKRTGEHTIIPPTTFASADVKGNWGGQYQLKYCNDAWYSAKNQGITYNERYHIYNKSLEKQGKTPVSIQEFLRLRGIDENININLPIYEAQARLIPSDQIEDAKVALKNAIDKELYNQNNPGRRELSKRYQDVLDKLTDHVESPNGAKSMPLTLEESKVLQSLAMKGSFDPAKYDITLAKKADRLYLTKSTLKSGLNSAIYDATFRVLPDIVESLSVLIKDGTISQEQISSIAKQGGSAAVEGFFLGCSVAVIENCSKSGVWGKEMQSLALKRNPAFNNVVVVMATTMVETMKDAIQVSSNKMDKRVFIQRLEKRVFMAACGHVVGSASQSVLPFAPVVGYMIGSFVGVVLGDFAFEVKEKAFMSLCVDYGFTCFGLVEQNYELPTSVKKYLGLDYFEFDEMNFDSFVPDRMQLDKFEFDKFEFDKLDIKLVKRGVIGIRKVGYVEAK